MWPHPGIFENGPLLTWPSSPVWVHLAPEKPHMGREQGLPGEGAPWCGAGGGLQ